jgi:hypothetical protein
VWLGIFWPDFEQLDEYLEETGTNPFPTRTITAELLGTRLRRVKISRRRTLTRHDSAAFQAKASIV